MSETKHWKPELKECREVLEALVKINTCQPEGNEEQLVDEIIKRLPDGVKYTKINHTLGRASLVVVAEGESQEGGIAFIGHIDTVACNDPEKWIYSPHQAEVHSNILYGRGASDMKGGDAAMILAMQQLARSGKKPKKPIYFCFTADEENKGMGICAIAESKCLDKVDEVIICEPSDEKIGLSEKGALWLKLDVQGVASHASRPDLGVSAVECAIAFYNQLKASVENGEQHSVLGETTVSVTRFDGGIMTNIIPPNANMELDIRTIPGTSHEKIIEKANAISKEMMSHCPKIKMELHVLNNRPALGSPEESSLVKGVMELAKEIGISTAPKGLYFYTDASQFIPNVPVPFVIAGPGDDALAHCMNEHINLASVARYAQLYCSYIMKYYT